MTGVPKLVVTPKPNTPKPTQFRYWLRELNYWRENHSDFLFGLFVTALAVVLVVAIWWAVQSDNRKEQRFMTECQQDHKRYECEALWRRSGS